MQLNKSMHSTALYPPLEPWVSPWPGTIPPQHYISFNKATSSTSSSAAPTVEDKASETATQCTKNARVGREIPSSERFTFVEEKECGSSATLGAPQSTCCRRYLGTKVFVFVCKFKFCDILHSNKEVVEEEKVLLHQDFLDLVAVRRGK